jgi:hypothetical protein
MTQADIGCDDQLTLSTIADRYSTNDGNRKSDTYFVEYQRLLGPRRDAPLRILELGVASGASLLTWRDYLPNATIVGIDIAAKPAVLEGQDRVHFIRASQDDTTALDLAGHLSGGLFDFIVDDASHLGYLTKRSFCYLFPRWLASGGYYVIEDFGTGYMPEYPDGVSFEAPHVDDLGPETTIFASNQHGMAGVVKQLIDHMMTELMTGKQSPFAIERVTVMTNIAFIAKCSGTSSDAAALPSGDIATSADTAPQLSPRKAEPGRQDARAIGPESAVGRSLGKLTPMRLMRRLPRPWRGR